ncbi:MAG: glycerol kinase GlpK [Candidatus Eiseniibacteriota bacterium]
MAGPLILAIDEGTTGARALLLDREGHIHGQGYEEIPQHYPSPGHVEHDAEEIWEATRSAIGKALASADLRGPGDVALKVAAIGLTNQRETTLLWERKTGRPLGRAIVWQDRRTAAMCDALKRAGHEGRVRRLTGLVLDPYFSGTKLTWLLRNVRGTARRAARGELAFGTMDTWLLWRLTGGRVHATDPTNASRTLLYRSDRLARASFDDALLDLFEVPRALLPEVRPSAGEFGTTRGVPGLPDGLPILGVAGDQQAALFGQGCVTSGAIKNTYGTGCFLMEFTGTKRVLSQHGLLTTVACGERGEPAYALEGAVFIAGAAIQWLRDALGMIGSAAETEALALSVPDTAGTTFVPAFAGLGAPHWNAHARGAWIGLTRGAGRAHLVRAVLEAIAWQTRDVVESMAKDSHRRPRALRVDGGAAANAFLMQFQADALGIPVVRPRMLETTALGAGLLAMTALGWTGIGRAARAAEATFKPRVSRAARESGYAAWTRAVNAVLAGTRALRAPARRA